MKVPALDRIGWHRHLSGGSPWHRADPRARLAFTLALSGVLLAAATWKALLPGAVVLVALAGVSRTGPAAAWGALRPFRFLLLLSAATHLVFAPGPSLAPGGMRPALEAWSAAGLLLARLCALILASAHLAFTTSPLELSRCFGWAVSPGRRLGLPAREIQLVMALGFSFVAVLLEESRRTRAALESRGVSLRHERRRLRLRAVLVWMFALLQAMLGRSARLATALEAKGFALDDRPRHRFPPWKSVSTLLLAATAALPVAAAFLR